MPSFKSILTIKMLKNISDTEIQKALKRVLIKKGIKNESKNIEKRQISRERLKENDNPKIQSSSLTSITGPSNQVSSQNVLDKSTQMATQPIQDVKQSETRKKAKPIKTTGTARSSLKFNPIAKEHSAELKILKDPTGKLYTNGDYEDFFDLTTDKFNKLYKLMLKRAEVHSSEKINRILRLTSPIDVSVIGLINEIRETKNGHYIMNLEDLTGTVNALIRKNAKDQDSFKMAQRSIPDQMVYVEGSYNPGDSARSKGIIFANSITKIDIPYNFKANRASLPLSLAMISDTHIGSKEFEEKLWNRFIKFLNGKLGDRDAAGKIKYIIINGDLIDGVGVYPDQKEDLIIPDIFDQYKKAAEMFSEIPEYIKIIYSPGNHEPVRNAIPRPAVPKKYVSELLDIGVKCVGNPTMVSTHGVNTLAFHGDSMLDLNLMVPGLDTNHPEKTMKEIMECRHLAPIFGKKTQIAPTNTDWLTIDKIPDIFHTGHVHINGMDTYKNVQLVNSGCFQSQTDFMRSLGITPTPGVVPIVELDTLNGIKLDLKNH